MEKRQAIRTGRGQYILTNMSLQEKKLIEHAPIREVIESSLFPGKEATTRMVYEQCRGLASYVVVRDVFHSVCGQLVTEGRAKKIVNGRYLILKNKF